VFIPLDYVIGGQDNIGKGWEMMMASLSVGRGISLPAVSAGIAKLAFRTTGAYARVREQFKSPIGKFEGVQEALGRIGGLTYLIESARVFTAAAIDAGGKPAIATAITKYHLTENARQLINDAMDIHAGRGLMMGERNYIAAAYMAAPIGITVEGANILTRNLIIFGQGAVRCHPYIGKEIAAVNNPDEHNGIARFDHLFFEHLGYTISNWVRAWLQSVTAGKLIQVEQKGFIRPYLKHFTRMSNALACISDVAMFTLGSELKRRERLSARLGDVLSNLYLASAIIKYYYDQGEHIEDKHFVRWSLQHCLSNIQRAFDDFLHNFPNRWLAWILKHSLFFLGMEF